MSNDPKMPTPMEWLTLFATIYDQTEHNPSVMRAIEPFHETMVELQRRISQTDPAKVGSPRVPLAERLTAHIQTLRMLPYSLFSSRIGMTMAMRNDHYEEEVKHIIADLAIAAERVVE